MTPSKFRLTLTSAPRLFHVNQGLGIFSLSLPPPQFKTAACRARKQPDDKRFQLHFWNWKRDSSLSPGSLPAPGAAATRSLGWSCESCRHCCLGAACRKPLWSACRSTADILRCVASHSVRGTESPRGCGHGHRQFIAVFSSGLSYGLFDSSCLHVDCATSQAAC